MRRILLSVAMSLAGCAPSPQKAAMQNPISENAPTNAAVGGTTDHAKSGPGQDTPAEALGRRTLSTAFVRIGPDGYLTVGLHDGRTVVLRDVVMRPRDYCGTPATPTVPGKRYCGGYAEVATARPGGGPGAAP